MSNGLFFYFLPGWHKSDAPPDSGKRTTRNELLASPLSGVFADVLRNERLFQSHVIQHFVNVGPNKSSGVLLVVKPLDWPDPHRIGFYPDEQVWTDCGDYWIGHHKTVLPGPASLARKPFVEGYEQELGDGQVWIAPVMRHFSPQGYYVALPQDLCFDEKGQYVEQVKPAFQWAWELACKIWDVYFVAGEVSRSEFLQWAIDCLSLNYRVGRHEARLLNLFDNDTARCVLRAAVDADLIDAYRQEQADSKKNQSTAEP